MKGKLKNDLILMIKGFVIGSSMSVPGVSGGTMAILLGIYDKLISSISGFLKDIKHNILYLIKFCIGAGVGIGSLAFVIKWLLEKFPLPVSFFFLGAVIGGIPALSKKVDKNKSKVSSALFFLSGIVIVIAISFIPTGNFNISSGSGPAHYVMLLITGIIIALALILPGISTSHMLLVLGMYDSMIAAITDFDIVYVGILGIATVIGIFLITKPIEWTMNTFPHQTHCMIIGFVLGSTYEIFKDKIIPAVPENTTVGWWVLAFIISLITFLLGYFAIQTTSKFSND
jgi:putative membrane protein